MTILRSGSSDKYAQNWASAFGGKKKKATKKTTAKKKKTTKKTTAKKKKTTKKKAAKKGKK